MVTDRRQKVIRTVELGEAGLHLASLIDEEFIISRDGLPVARVMPIRDQTSVPRIGFLPDLAVPDDFDEMGADATGEGFQLRPSCWCAADPASPREP